MLALALAGYLLTTWAWSLLAPLAPLLGDSLSLTPIMQAMVVALPVVVGALSRIPAGALSDRFGARTAFLTIIVMTIVALLVLAYAGRQSAQALLGASVLLGVAGGTFAAAVPFVSGWFPERRGLAIGILGLGLCGSAVGGVTAVRLAEAYGMKAPFLATALTLALLGLLVAVTMRDAPHAPRAATGIGAGLIAAMRLPVTRKALLWYAVGFAIFVASSTALPVYLDHAYHLPAARSGDVMAGFVLLAVLTRPLGGWLADHFGPARPLVLGYAAALAVLVVQAWTPPLPVLLGLVLPVLAVTMGMTSTAVLAQVSGTAPPVLVGLITGLISAAGGLTGFATPLMLAASYQRTGTYGPGYAVLAAAAALALTTALRTMREPQPSPSRSPSPVTTSEP
ncbi:MFS transporter [Actinoplanes sp. NPDC051861]|uniref:MFS transporter n=1 Tax=Actinoplanes sp. NPDC051861 TaxID=3155170 RepID=UPI0034181E37